MNHDELLQGSFGFHAATFGSEATYVAPGDTDADAVTLENVMASQETERLDEAVRGERFHRVRFFEVVIDPAHESYCGVEEILRSGLITYAGVKYMVHSPRGSDSSFKLVFEGRRIDFGRQERQGLRS